MRCISDKDLKQQGLIMSPSGEQIIYTNHCLQQIIDTNHCLQQIVDVNHCLQQIIDNKPLPTISRQQMQASSVDNRYKQLQQIVQQIQPSVDSRYEPQLLRSHNQINWLVHAVVVWCSSAAALQHYRNCSMQINCNQVLLSTAASEKILIPYSIDRLLDCLQNVAA